MGEGENGRLRLDFDGHLRLEFSLGEEQEIVITIDDQQRDVDAPVEVVLRLAYLPVFPSLSPHLPRGK